MDPKKEPVSIHAELENFRQSLDRDFTSAVEAARFVDLMQTQQPAAFTAWALDQVTEIVRIHLMRSIRSDRAIAFNRQKARSFAANVEAGKSLELYSKPFQIDANNTMRPLGEMYGKDCDFVASSYHTHGKRLLMLSSFFDCLAKKAGMKKVKSVMSEAECERLLASIIGSPSSLPA